MFNHALTSSLFLPSIHNLNKVMYFVFCWLYLDRDGQNQPIFLFENRNHYKTVISKIKIITNYEFLKPKSIGNQVIVKIIFKITFKLWLSFMYYSNFIWVISDCSCQTWKLYKRVEYIIYDTVHVKYDEMRSYMMTLFNISLHSLCSNSKRV